MNRMKIEIFCVLLLFTSCASTQYLNKNKAIEIAERYILEQGYAEKKLNLKKTKIDADILDQYQTLEKIAELRHNLLYGKAVYSKQNGKIWVIGFKYKKDKSSKKPKEGKGILISENGKKIQMFHENIIFE